MLNASSLLYHHLHHLGQELISSWSWNSVPCQQWPQPSLLPSLTTITLALVSNNLIALYNSCRKNHGIFALCIYLLSQSSISRVHPCCSMHQNFSSLLGCSWHLPWVGRLCVPPVRKHQLTSNRPSLQQTPVYLNGVGLFAEQISSSQQEYCLWENCLNYFLFSPELKSTCDNNHDLKQVLLHQVPIFSLRCITGVVHNRFSLVREKE